MTEALFFVALGLRSTGFYAYEPGGIKGLRPRPASPVHSVRIQAAAYTAECSPLRRENGAMQEKYNALQYNSKRDTRIETTQKHKRLRILRRRARTRRGGARA